MSEMIELVAKALARSAGCKLLTGSESAATREFGWDINHSYLGKYVEAHWKEHVQAARWALEAMRVPTEAMIIAGCRHENMGDMAGRWCAMIDAALSTPSDSERK